VEIRDVIGNIRGDVLQLQQEVKSLRSYVDALERFTWNMISLINQGTTEIVIHLEEEESDASEPPLPGL